MSKLEFNLGEFAQAWCTKENEKKEMDVELAKACHKIAQRQYDRWLEQQPVVYTNEKNMFWTKSCGHEKFQAHVVYKDAANNNH